MKRKPLYDLQDTLHKKGIQYLMDELAIKVNQHPKYRNLHQFTYNQIESPSGNNVVKACRGIILDKNNLWKPVCHSYDRFFNAGEGHAEEIDWNTAKVYEKCDGSLIQMWYYDGEWQISTKGTPDAEANTPFGGKLFKDLFWEVWNELGYDPPYREDYCYAFELMTPYNRVVVPHAKNRIVLHGIRDLNFEFELNPNVALSYGQLWETVRQFDFGYTDEIEKALKDMDGMDQEGFVIVDGSFNRIKMKSEDYVRKHKLVSSLSQRNLLDIIRNGEGSEFLAYFPEWKKEYDKIRDKFEKLVVDVDSTYNKYKNMTRQKDFADMVKGHRFSGAMFALRSGKKESVREYLKEMNIKHLEQALDLKDERRNSENN